MTSCTTMLHLFMIIVNFVNIHLILTRVNTMEDNRNDIFESKIGLYLIRIVLL